MKVNNTLQQLVFGDRNTFIFVSDKHDSDSENVNAKQAFKILMSLNKLGYGISNPDIMFNWSKYELLDFVEQFNSLIESNTKDGFIFRKTFAESEALTAYTSEEWMAIFAQYAITYGWQDKYASETGKFAENVLNDYVGTLDFETQNELDNSKLKMFSIGTEADLFSIVKKIVESKTVLRSQQKETLKNTPVELLIRICRNSNITIKENLVLVMKLLSGKKLDFPLFKTSTDVLRFVVSSYAVNPIEGQINKTLLKGVKIHVPTSVRKQLLNNLELIGDERSSKFLCEDMFSYDSFWKILDKYLRYESSEKTRAKYPMYTGAIDLLYEDDRSWTFNGRISKAKEELDYLSAINVMKERPGFLLRNLINFIRMTTGAKLPTKEKTKLKLTVNNAFQNALTKTSSEKISGDVIIRGAESFLLSDEFERILNKNINTKLAWQLIEQLKDKKLFEEVYSKTVQGIEVSYTTPIPAVDKDFAKKIRKIILKAVKNKLKERNSGIDSIYIDGNSAGVKLQYSGRDSTEISYSGEFLTPGTELNLLDLIKEKEDIEDPLLRLGVMWRGKKSTDLDHSVSFNNGSVCYYGHPMITGLGGVIVAVSSGDVVTCGGVNSTFSGEMIDIDLLEVKNTGIKEFYNSFINYSGSTTIGELECYTLFSLIDKKDRLIKGNKMTVDLSKQDYAIRIDPDNIDKTGSYIGCSVDLEKNVIKVLSIPVKNSGGHYSNARTNYDSFKKAIGTAKVDGLTIGYAIKKVFKGKLTEEPKDANVVISRTPRDDLDINEDVTLLHPGRNQEEINNLLF